MTTGFSTRAVILANTEHVPRGPAGWVAANRRKAALPLTNRLAEYTCGGTATNGFPSATASLVGSTALVTPVGETQEPSSGWGAASSVSRWSHARILIVDDCTLFRENLATALTANADVATSAVAWDLRSLRAALEGSTPSIVLLSISTRDSAVLLREAVESRPDAKVIAVGVSEDDEPTIVACAEAGVTGYHLRSESLADLLLLIRKVTDGESACSPSVAPILLRRLSTLAAERRPGPKEPVLTRREMEILRMLEAGLSNRDIADQLCIAVHTVKNHVHSVLGKLGVSTRVQAVALRRSLQYPDVPPT